MVDIFSVFSVRVEFFAGEESVDIQLYLLFEHDQLVPALEGTVVAYLQRVYRFLELHILAVEVLRIFHFLVFCLRLVEVEAPLRDVVLVQYVKRTQICYQAERRVQIHFQQRLKELSRV